MNKGKFYLRKCNEPGNEYSPELQMCIEKAYDYCEDALSNNTNGSTIKPIMLLGKIQSGKTRAFTGLMALAFDNHFDVVFVLTKNSSALVEQTYKRMRREFKEEINQHQVDVFDIMKIIDGLTGYELNKKLIIIAKKETNNLDKISKFISDYQIAPNKFCLVIDDEADTTSIGFTKVKDTANEFDLRTVASKINSIRGSLNGYVFVQVTATPYALYLQPDFNEEEIESVRPYKTVLVPSGKGYIGGEYYFLESKQEGSPARYIFEEVSSEELDLAVPRPGKIHRNKFKDEEIFIRRDKLRVFKNGLINFIVGVCVLQITSPNELHLYSYVIHVNTQKDAHLRLETLTKNFLQRLKNRDQDTEPIIEELLTDSYKDIEKSFVACGHSMPKFDDVRKAFFNAIDGDAISITVVNSDSKGKNSLDEENGELRLRTPFSIFVGGQKMDRGVTIPKMIGFYYGRNPKIMQQDTVLQHSRMFGYRNEILLSVTRFYTTRSIYENLTKITEIDVALREDIEKERFDAGIYFIREDEKGKIIPCSPEKIRMSNVVMLNDGKRIFPIGFTPIAKTYASRIAKSVNRELSKLIDEHNKDSVLVSAETLEEIVKLAYSAIKKDEDSARFVSVEKLVSTIRYLSQKDKKVYLIVRRGRKLSKFKENGTVYSDSPDTPQDELALARKLAKEYPVLMMIHQDGTALGWNGAEFWWPVLLTPEKTPKTIFALDEPDGRLKRARRKTSRSNTPSK